MKGLLAGLSLVIGSVGFVPGSAHAESETGRVDVESSTRIMDTRGEAPIAAGADVPIDGGIHTVTARVDEGGRIDTVECGSASPGTPLIVGPPESDDPGTGRFTQRTVVAPSGSNLCLRPSFELKALIVDRHRFVSGSLTVGGLQYVPLDEAVTVASGDFAGSTDSSVPKTYVLPTADLLPADADAATLSIEDFADRGGYVVARDCTVPATSLSTSLTFGRVVVNVDVAPGNDVCLDLYGDMRLRVDLLGYLSTEGPDPMRLPPGTADAVTDLAPAGFAPISPVRLFDTREDEVPPEPGDDEAPLVPEDEATVLATDLSEFTTPSTTAVTVNVTATRAAGKGFVTVWPCEDEPPTVSNLNFEPGPPVANLVTVRLYESSLICFGASTTVDLIADIAGTFESDAGALSTPVAPVRILDTRDGTGAALGALSAGSTLTLQVAGRNGIPSTGVEAVTMNVTSARSSDSGYLTLWPCDEPQPEASSVNFNKGLPVANLATVKLSVTGTVCIFSSATTDVVADVGLYYDGASTSGFLDVVPERVLDSREALGVTTTSKLAANQQLVLQVTGRGAVPASGAVAVTMNVTAVNPDTGGFLTVWPCDRPQPNTSNLNFQAGANVPNLVSVLLSANGTICISGSSATHVLADVAGYTTSEPGRGMRTVLTPG